MRILITGSSGFVGSYLKNEFQKTGHDVFGVSRTKKEKKTILWPPSSLEDLEHFDLVIHLAGESVAKGYWSKKKMKQIYRSRVNFTKEVVAYLQKLKHPPKMFFSASAMGYYGSGKNRTEETPNGNTFLAKVCHDWEEASSSLREKNIRTLYMRFGHVLHPSGGFLKPLIFMTKWYFANIWGSGKQTMSWIALEDIFHAIEFCMQKELSGPVNFTAPNSVSQKEFMQQLTAFYHRPLWLKLPEKFLKATLGDMGKELFLVDLEAPPKKMQESGYTFMYPTLESFLKTLENKH